MINDFIISDVNLEGFQVVHSGYFLKQQAPQMTLWRNAVQFNTMAYLMLSKCECIKMMIHNKARQILIQPCASKDPDAITWLKNPNDAKTTKLLCEALTRQIFVSWDLDKALHYRTNGTLVRSDERLMMLFDFKSAEAWNGMKMVKHR